MAIELGYYDDKKQKHQSHEIAFVNNYSSNPFDITGYGRTKEEALEDFKEKFECIMNELNAFSKMLSEEDIATVDVDCFGKKIVS